MRQKTREAITDCGEFVEIDIYPVFRQPTRRRRAKYKPTSDAQAKLNQHNAQKQFERLLNANFTEDSIRLDLTYSPSTLPSDVDSANAELSKFLRRLKRYRKKNGLDELKYIAVTEQSPSGRIHHHLITNGGVDINTLQKIWGKGYTSTKPLVPGDSGLAPLAQYLTKQRTGYRRFSHSKNLIIPPTKKRDGRISGRVLRALFQDPSREEIETLYPGLKLAEYEASFNPINLGVYVHLLMRRERKKDDKKRVPPQSP